MKQKVTSIFLLATLVLSLLVGCSTDEGNSSNYPVESPSSVSSGIVGSPQSTDSVEQSSADADDSGVEAEDPSGSNGQSNMTGQEIDQPVSSTLPTEIAAATSFHFPMLSLIVDRLMLQSMEISLISHLLN